RAGHLLRLRKVRDENPPDILLGSQGRGGYESQEPGDDEQERNDGPESSRHSALLRQSQDTFLRPTLITQGGADTSRNGISPRDHSRQSPLQFWTRAPHRVQTSLHLRSSVRPPQAGQGITACGVIRPSVRREGEYTTGVSAAA